MPEQTHKHDIAINMPRHDWWLIKKKGFEDSTRAQGMSPSVCDYQGEKLRKTLKFGCRPKFWRVLQPLQHLMTQCLNTILSISIHLHRRPLAFQEVLVHCASYIVFPTYPKDKRGSLSTNSVKHNKISS